MRSLNGDWAEHILQNLYSVVLIHCMWKYHEIFLVSPAWAELLSKKSPKISILAYCPLVILETALVA